MTAKVVEIPAFEDSDFEDATAFLLSHRQHELDLAVGQARRLVDLNSNAAKVEFQGQNFEKAAQFYSNSLRILESHCGCTGADADRVTCLNNLALMTLKQQQFEKCAEYCDQVLASGIDDVRARKKASWRQIQAHNELGHRDKCLEYLEVFLQRFPKFKPAKSLLAELTQSESGQSSQEDQDITEGNHKGYCFVCDAPCTQHCPKCTGVFYCSVECQRLHWVDGRHRRTCNTISIAKSYARRGVKGIFNSGNTCYMAAALQCLTHTPATGFKNFFVLPDDTKRKALRSLNGVVSKLPVNVFSHDLNPNSVHGSKGIFVKAFADFFRKYWVDVGLSTMSLGRLKSCFGEFRSAFRGFSQEDSLECFSSLLDLVHEDVNRIKRKEYVERDDSSAEDRAASLRAWGLHKLRNDSKVVELFHGQFKSKLVCPTCQKVSVSFEALSSLSLELADAKPAADVHVQPATRPGFVHKTVFVVRRGEIPTLFAVELERDSLVVDLKGKFATLLEVAVDQLVLLDIYQGRVYAEFYDNLPVTEIKRQDRPFLYVLPHAVTHPEWAHVVVHQRIGLTATDESSDNDGSMTTSPLLADPVVVSFERRSTTVKVFEELCAEHLCSVVNAALSGDTVDDATADVAISREQLVSMLTEGRASITLLCKGDQPGKPSQLKALHGLKDNLDDTLAMDVLPDEILLPAAFGDQGVVQPDGSTIKFPGPKNPIGCRQLCALFCVEEQPEVTASPKPRVDPSASDYLEAVKAEQEARARAISGPSLTLQNLLHRLRVPEKLDGDNMWYCNKCEEHKEATKTMAISMLPKVLVFHLKRFRFRNSIFSDKINTFVDFPTEGLDMAPFLEHPESTRREDTSTEHTPKSSEGECASTDDEIMQKKEMRDLLASLKTWRHNKLRKYDTNEKFRKRRDAKHGEGRENYVKFLDEVVEDKIKEAVDTLKAKKKALQKSVQQFESFVSDLMEKTELSRVEATAKARQHFLDLGQKEVIDVFFDERKLELQQLEANAMAAAVKGNDGQNSAHKKVCTVYDLYAVCNHFGGGLHSGHYTAIARQISAPPGADGASIDNTPGAPASNLEYGPWIHFDDQYVTEASSVVTNRAYYLCYVRRDSVDHVHVP